MKRTTAVNCVRKPLTTTEIYCDHVKFEVNFSKYTVKKKNVWYFILIYLNVFLNFTGKLYFTFKVIQM